MKKLQIIVCIAALVGASCTNRKKLEEEHRTLLEQYKASPSAEKAVKTAEFYNIKYKKSIKQMEKGINFIKNARKHYPDSIELAVLESNLYTMLGGKYSMKLDYSKAMKYCDLGFMGLDTAVENNPGNVYARFWRGANSVSLPTMMKRLDIGLKDLEILLERSDIPKKYRISSLHYYHMGLKKNKQKDKAKKVMEELQTAYPYYKEVVGN